MSLENLMYKRNNAFLHLVLDYSKSFGLQIVH